MTHAGCRAVRDHPRNLADWQLEGLAERGGVLGMMALSFVVDPDAPTLSRWLDHFDHAVGVMGIEHVGLEQTSSTRSARSHGLLDGTTARDGSGGQDALRTRRLHRAGGFPSLVTALRGRGYDGQRLEAITSGNWLRILRETLPP